MTADTLRAAAARLREVAEAVNAEIDGGHYYWANDRANYGPGVRDGLGGASGELAATMSPPVALALADWLDHEADRLTADMPFDIVLTPGEKRRSRAVANTILATAVLAPTDPDVSRVRDHMNKES